MSKVRVIDLWTERVIRQILSYLRSPLQIGNVDTGNYTEFGTDGRQSFHGTADLQFNIAQVEPAWSEGLTFYDPQEKTLATFCAVSGVKLNHGQELQLRAVNKTGAPILNGTPVFVDTAQGNRPTIGLARSDTYTKAVKTIGLVTQDSIANNAIGYVTTFGIVHDVPTNMFAVGDEVWLAPTGGLQNTLPITGQCRIRVGYVLVSHAVQGEIFVAPLLLPMNFGDVVGGNYTEFEADGTMRANGGAKVWNDLIINPAATNGGAASPSSRAYNGSTNIITPDCFSGQLNNDIVGTAEMQHDYAEGTDWDFHVHFANEIAMTAGQTIIWQLDYDIVGMNSGTHTTGTRTGTYTSPVGGTPAWTHHYLDVGAVISGAGRKIGDIISFCLTRQANNDSFSGATAFAHLLSIGIHYECDTLGSREETSK